mgnify:CR=1 FL=1
MESTAARRPPANDEGVCGMFINLFRRQRPALARLARRHAGAGWAKVLFGV